MQVVINCRYSIAQMCTRKDILASIFTRAVLDDVMSQNELTTIVIMWMQSFFLIFNCTCWALNIFDSNTRCPNSRNNEIVDFYESTIQCCQIWQFAAVWATFQTIWQQIFCLGFAICLHSKSWKNQQQLVCYLESHAIWLARICLRCDQLAGPCMV